MGDIIYLHIPEEEKKTDEFRHQFTPTQVSLNNGLYPDYCYEADSKPLPQSPTQTPPSTTLISQIAYADAKKCEEAWQSRPASVSIKGILVKVNGKKSI